MLPREQNPRRLLPEEVGRELEDEVQGVGKIIKTMGENFLAWKRGGQEAVMHSPLGWEKLPTGEIRPKLPFYIITPTHTGEGPAGATGNTWKVPRASMFGSGLMEGETRAIQILGAEQSNLLGDEGVKRPVAVLVADPVIPGNNVLCEIGLARGFWKPSLVGKMPVFIKKSTRAVSLADGRSIGRFLRGLEGGGDEEELDVTNLTAGPLVDAMLKWLNETYDGEYGPAFVDRNGLMEGLAIIGQFNPSWAAYWENVAARERLSAVLNSPLGNGPLILGNIFNLSVMTYPQHSGELKTTMNEFLLGLEQKQATDWPSLVRFARQVFNDLDIPIVLNPSVNPVQSLLAATYGRSLTGTKPVMRSLEKQQSKDEGQLLEMPWVKNPYELLLAFPTSFAILGEAMMTTFPDRLAAIAQQKVDFVNAGLDAELGVDRAYTEAMTAFTRSLQQQLDGVMGIRFQAKRAGKKVAHEIGKSLPGNIESVLGDLYRTIDRLNDATQNLDPGVLGLPPSSGSKGNGTTSQVMNIYKRLKNGRDRMSRESGTGGINFPPPEEFDRLEE